MAHFGCFNQSKGEFRREFENLYQEAVRQRQQNRPFFKVAAKHLGLFLKIFSMGESPFRLVGIFIGRGFSETEKAHLMKLLISMGHPSMDICPPYWTLNPQRLKIVRISGTQEKAEVQNREHFMKRMLNQNIVRFTNSL